MLNTDWSFECFKDWRVHGKMQILMSENVVHAKLAFEVNVSDFLATPSFYRNEIISKMFLIIIKG